LTEKYSATSSTKGAIQFSLGQRPRSAAMEKRNTKHPFASHHILNMRVRASAIRAMVRGITAIFEGKKR
jgi:hypothetical protein